jgi:hypothetical protein
MRSNTGRDDSPLRASVCVGAGVAAIAGAQGIPSMTRQSRRTIVCVDTILGEAGISRERIHFGQPHPWSGLCSRIRRGHEDAVGAPSVTVLGGGLMASLQAGGAVVLAGLFAAACGGADFSTGPVTGNEGGAAQGDATMNDDALGVQDDSSASDGALPSLDAAGTNDAPSAQADSSGNDGAASMDANGGSDGASSTGDGGDASDAGRVTPDAMVDATGAPCPDVRGGYSIAFVQVQGCGTLNATAPQCIRQGMQGGCGINFRSVVPAGFAAINGNASLQSDGSFANAALIEGGGASRTGCTGSWDAATSTMTVDCGGSGSTQSCIVALTRTGTVCN